MPSLIPPGPVLLYDGLCGFCNGTVRFVLARDRRGVMRFAPLQGQYAREILARHAELRGVDSLILIEWDGREGTERVFTRSDAVLRLADHLGGRWHFAATLRAMPRRLRDAAYDAFARVRYSLFGRYETCPLPSAAQRTRFID